MITKTRKTVRKTAIKPGTTFSYPHADSNSLFTVVEKRGADTYQCEVKAHPQHGTMIDWLGVKKVFGGEEIRGALNYSKTLSALSSRADNFWASRTVGEIVHYHNGFGQYVRGEIVATPDGMKMRPTALVGAWTHDLPKRGRNGEVIISYHVKKIRAGELMSPNDGFMFESPNFSRPMGASADFDPTKTEALDISDPAPLGGDEARLASYEKLRMDLTGILGDGHRDPLASLLKAREMINALIVKDMLEG